MLTVTTSSTQDRLTSLDKLKAQLGITTTTEDDLLEEAILQASQTVATYIGYYPLEQSYRETLAGYGSRNLMVSRTPVTTLAAIYYGSTGTVVDPASYHNDNPEAGIIARDLGFNWTAGVEWDLDQHVAPRSERKDFIVDYTAGWVFTTGAGRTLPPDIEKAVLEQAKSNHLSGQRDPSIVSKRVGDLSITYSSRGSREEADTSLSGSVSGLLEQYRRIK